MHRYSMMLSNKEILDIPIEFENCFKVDLNSESFKKYKTLEERWNAIVMATGMCHADIDLKILGKSSFEYYIDSYRMYEWDVWLNAYFSIKYLMAKSDTGTIKGIASDTHTLRDFKLPFESDIITKFCAAYKTYFFTKERKSIFDVKKIYIEKDKKVKFRDNLYMESWSYKKIMQAEFENTFNTEDRILFYKTIDCNLARKLTLYYYYKGELDITCEKEDFFQMCKEKEIAKIESFAWKNLYVDLQVKALRMCDGEVDMTETEYEAFIKAWMEKQVGLLELGATILEKSERINERLRTLTRGLIYCILNSSASEEIVNQVIKNVVRANAECAMEKLMEIESRECQLFPIEDAKELRIKSAEFKILKFYALMQAKVILYNPKYGWEDSE